LSPTLIMGSCVRPESVRKSRNALAAGFIDPHSHESPVFGGLWRQEIQGVVALRFACNAGWRLLFGNGRSLPHIPWRFSRCVPRSRPGTRTRPPGFRASWGSAGWIGPQRRRPPQSEERMGIGRVVGTKHLRTKNEAMIDAQHWQIRPPHRVARMHCARANTS